ncbi:MAG: hypothetical protein IKA22_06370 [Lentisphaeria bacterium]|nr:hypothetical protein [Lentisphaeria bacterium]
MNNLMMCEGKYVSRGEVALVSTPGGTESWKPVSYMEVIEAVTDVVKAHNWQIQDENFGLAREGQNMFGVMRINKSNSSDCRKFQARNLYELLSQTVEEAKFICTAAY